MKLATTHQPKAGTLFNAFLPVALLGLSVMLVIGLQTKGEIARRSSLNAGIEQRVAVAKQGEKVRPQLDKLATELYQLSQSDATARNIVRKYRIQVGKPAAQ